MAASDKLTENVGVRLSEADVIEINKFIHESKQDITASKVLRISWKYLKKTIDEQGLVGVLLKLLDEA
jgi:hypothetical protein